MRRVSKGIDLSRNVAGSSMQNVLGEPSKFGKMDISLKSDFG
jgi:hypothetical protein